MHIKKNDTIKIISGKDRGKTGKILRAWPAENRVTVEGLNLYKKRVRPKAQGQKGETVMVPRPLAASKMMLICQSCKKPTRVGYRIEGATKRRYCNKCGANT